MNRKNKNVLAFPCDNCFIRNKCMGECSSLSLYFKKNKLYPVPRREKVISGNIFSAPPKSIEQLAAKQIDFEKKEEKEKYDILSAMYVKIQNIKHKQKKIGAIRKYFVYLCKLFDLSEIQITQILKIHRATYFRNSI